MTWQFFGPWHYSILHLQPIGNRFHILYVTKVTKILCSWQMFLPCFMVMILKYIWIFKIKLAQGQWIISSLIVLDWLNAFSPFFPHRNNHVYWPSLDTNLLNLHLQIRAFLTKVYMLVLIPFSIFNNVYWGPRFPLV